MPPYPKHPSARARRHKTATHTELVVRDPNEVEIPSMPARFRIVDGERIETDWHPEAEATWIEVWTSPMVAEFLEADQGGVRALLMLENDMWERFERGKSITEIAAEVSRIRKNFGLAPMGRRSLQWTVAQTAETVQRVQRRSANAIEVSAEEIPSLPSGEVEELLGVLE